MSNIKTRNQCEKCSGWFSARGGNYSRHVASCNGTYPTHKDQCPHRMIPNNGMSLSTRANHARWCEKNPKKRLYIEHASNLNSFQTCESRNKARDGLKKAHARGLFSYKERAQKMVKTKIKKGNLYPTQESRNKMKNSALLSTRRRLRRNLIEYNGVLLDSSWELALAKRLDELQINWIRPDTIKWTDNDGNLRNYFPDFYLPDHDLYLDPKNPFAVKVQKDKLARLLADHDNIMILDSLDKCKTFVI